MGFGGKGRGGGGKGGGRGGGGGGAVYVGNLSWETSWQDLKDHFRAAGEVSHADVMMEHDGRSKGCAIVRFASAQDAANAIQQLHDSELQGRTIFVREDREAGGGGGGGGGYSAETGGLPPPVVQYNAPAASRAVGGGRGEGAQQYGAPAVGLPPARPKATGGGSGSQVYVGNLSWDTSWQDLKDHFRAAGEVSHADVMMEHEGRSKGCGIVSFTGPRDAANAISSLNQSELGPAAPVGKEREPASLALCGAWDAADPAASASCRCLHPGTPPAPRHLFTVAPFFTAQAGASSSCGRTGRSRAAAAMSLGAGCPHRARARPRCRPCSTRPRPSLAAACRRHAGSAAAGVAAAGVAAAEVASRRRSPRSRAAAARVCTWATCRGRPLGRT